MKTPIATSVLFVVVCMPVALTQELNVNPSGYSTAMEVGGAPASSKQTATSLSHDLSGLPREFPSGEISKHVQSASLDVLGSTRSAKDAQLFRTVAPSVVLIATNDATGSGSLLSLSGDVITNWHVVKGSSDVAIIFKPSVEGQQPTRDDVRLGKVVRYDEVADLALLKVSQIPVGRAPIRLGDASEIAIGSDVHAIGHPTGQAWTYTKGVISQYRLGYEWAYKDEKFKHKADAIQTQTPINPGNSGGPLISDSGTLIGVNSFKSEGENLNFAVSIDDVKKFLARSGNRLAQGEHIASSKPQCDPKVVSRFRNKENTALIVSYDMFCTGKASGEYVYPDKQTDPVYLRLDRNGDGRGDAMIFDFKREGKWELSFWDEKFEGRWTLVGYHDDGGLKPTRFESYGTFEARLAKR